MLLDALDHGEEDLTPRRLAENRVEAGRILQATRRRSARDAELLEPGESRAHRAGDARLSRARAAASDPARIHRVIEALDDASKEFAARRMNRAIALAIEGRGTRSRRASSTPKASSRPTPADGTS